MKQDDTQPQQPRRNAHVSADRLRIEEILRGLPDGETMSLREIVTASRSSTMTAGQALQSMRKDGFAVNRGGPGQSQWCCTKSTRPADKPTPSGKADEKPPKQGSSSHLNTRETDPICNGNQPNGSLDYWQAFQTRLMTPARQSANNK